MNNKKILIIEDDKRLVDTIKPRLLVEGYNVDAIYEGKAALEKIREFQPDIILLDIMLPGKDGRDILIELRKDALLKDIPVVVISGKDQQYDRIYGLELGAIEYIIKPFSLVFLSQKIKRLLKKK